MSSSQLTHIFQRDRYTTNQRMSMNPGLSLLHVFDQRLETETWGVWFTIHRYIEATNHGAWKRTNPFPIWDTTLKLCFRIASTYFVILYWGSWQERLPSSDERLGLVHLWGGLEAVWVRASDVQVLLYHGSHGSQLCSCVLVGGLEHDFYFSIYWE